MRSVLGIYFGIRHIAVVEASHKKIINSIQISLEGISAGELEEKVPEEVKLVAALKNELRNAGIEAREAALTLPGNDLIIRSFEIGLLPREELASAVNFEAKKYIPFKTEELVSDFQVRTDRKAKNNLILFFSIKKEILDKYLSVVGQLGLSIINIEYAAFSLLRMLDLKVVKKKGVFAVLDIDLEEETNFTVIENGFPLFSRDINLTTGLEAQSDLTQGAPFLERLKNEVRISLDYYRRKFPTKKMNRLIVVAEQAYKNDVEALANELGLPSEFIDISLYTFRQSPLSISAVKAYSASLANSIKTPLRLNLLSSREKLIREKTAEAEPEIALPAIPLRLDYRVVAVGLAIILLSFIAGFYQKAVLNKEIKNILNNRISLTTISSKSYPELQATYSEYVKKADALDKITKNHLYLTEEFNIIPEVFPENCWLVNLFFRQAEEGVEMVLTGQAFYGDRNQEFEAINKIASDLKANSIFSKVFQYIEVTSLERVKLEDAQVTNFIISCKGKKYGI